MTGVEKRRHFNIFRGEDNDGQAKSLVAAIELKQPAVRTVLGPVKYQRKYTYEYSLIVNGRRQQVCRTTLMSVYGITTERIKTIKKKLEAGETSPRDMRGKHTNHKTLPDTVRENIRQHIRSFPTYESHYCRADADPTRRYLPPGLTITMMYQLFIQHQRDNGLPESEKWAYDDIFNREFRHLSLSTPKNDTCDQCDIFKAKLADATAEERVIIEQERNRHQAESKYI